ncbi:MAG: hypothetical protein M3P84_12850, partial [Chloroflexota bacterium]|nr:hypothetical protein [Chloroflexota bacterium]
VILGYAEILLGEVPAVGSPREELEVIRSEALRARSIVQSLLELARSRPPDPRPADLAMLPVDPLAAPVGVPIGV